MSVYSLDALSFSTTLPPLASPPTALAFVPASSLLVLALASGQLYVYDVDRREPTDWSRANAGPLPALHALISGTASAGRLSSLTLWHTKLSRAAADELIAANGLCLDTSMGTSAGTYLLSREPRGQQSQLEYERERGDSEHRR